MCGSEDPLLLTSSWVRTDPHQAEFYNPATYENYTPADWSDLAATLAPNVPRNPEDGSIPLSYFKYNSDFRRGIREFQEDLSSGRLDPAWQAAAAKAMEERAQGRFDAYKETQFEEFWGQKQKVPWHALAGESAKLKLDDLIQNGLFKEGDVFSYSRAVGRGRRKLIIEKDCTVRPSNDLPSTRLLTFGEVQKLGKSMLTVAIPPDRLKYTRRPGRPSTTADLAAQSLESELQKTDMKEAAVNDDEKADVLPLREEDDTSQLLKKEMTSETSPADKNGSSSTLSEIMNDDLCFLAGVNYEMGKDIDELEKDQMTGATNQCLPQGTQVSLPDNVRNKDEGSVANWNIGDVSASAQLEDAICYDITTLQQLENKVIDVDGRLKSSDVPSVNAWRFIRCKRNNQDLGSLFEMREEYYVYKHPQMVKTPQEQRNKARRGDD